MSTAKNDAGHNRKHIGGRPLPVARLAEFEICSTLLRSPCEKNHHIARARPRPTRMR